MKQYQLARKEEIVALINCHEIEVGKSPFLCMIRNEKQELLASIYLGHGITVQEIASDKSLPTEK